MSGDNILDYSDPQGRYEEVCNLLHEARLQIEYLHAKFQPTGSGNSVLARIDAVLRVPA